MPSEVGVAFDASGLKDAFTCPVKLEYLKLGLALAVVWALWERKQRKR